MTNPDRGELVKIADELDGWHDCADGDVSAGNGHFRVVCESDSEQQRLNLRATLREASTALRRLASSEGGEVKVKPLVWRDHRPDSFPEPAWSAQTSFGFYNIEEVSASDSPAYVVRLHAHHFLADKDSLDDAKAAAQADYEARIRSALVEVPAVKGEPEPVADWRDDPTSDERWNAGCDFAMTQLCKALGVDPATVNWDAATETVDGDVQSVIWNILRARMGEDWDPDTASPADAGMREALEPRLAAAERMADGIKAFLDKPEWRPTRAYIEQARNVLRNMVRHVRVSLTAPGATTKSDGGVLSSLPSGESEPVVTPAWLPSDPSSTRSEVTALADVAKERQRQREVEGWTPEHDDTHDRGEMASAAACYALSAAGLRCDDGARLRFWPWDRKWWKPKTPRENLVRAGALIVAEIERLDRLDRRK